MEKAKTDFCVIDYERPAKENWGPGDLLCEHKGERQEAVLL